MKVLVSPGHSQYENRGYVAGYYEGTQMWKLAKFLQAELEAYGIEVTNTRPQITDNPKLELRGKLAAGHDLAIYLHSNAIGSSGDYLSVYGVTMYDSFEKPNPELAEKLGRAISDAMNTKYNGVRRRENDRADRKGQDWYGELRNAIHVGGCPTAFMPEHGFHTNPDDCAKLMKDSVLQDIAKAEASVIAEHYGIKKEGEIMLQKGDKNEQVGAWQRALLEAGYAMTSADASVVYGVDNSFGGATERATKEFQKENGLAITGVVDAVTVFEMTDLLSSEVHVAEESAEGYREELARTQSKLAESNRKLNQIKAIL